MSPVKNKKSDIIKDKVDAKSANGVEKTASIVKNVKTIKTSKVAKAVKTKVKTEETKTKKEVETKKEEVKNKPTVGSTKELEAKKSKIDNPRKETVKKTKTVEKDKPAAKKNTNHKLVAVGRRKTAVARVFLQKGSGVVFINNKEMNVFSPNNLLNYKILQPLDLIKGVNDFDVHVNVSGGGQSGQVEAIRLGIARCLLKFDINYRSTLKDLGYLTRDPRMAERKKYGHKKARRSFQFSKR